MLIQIVAVLTALCSTVIADGYEYGRTYHYDYKGYIYTGFTGLKSQLSGLAFTSNVVVLRHEDYYVVQLEHVRFDKFHSEVDDLEERDYNYRYLPSLTRQLTQPVKVYLRNGQIYHYEVSSDEEVWSVNIKRGLLSLFNLNLDQDDSNYVDTVHGDRRHDRNYEKHEDGRHDRDDRHGDVRHDREHDHDHDERHHRRHYRGDPQSGYYEVYEDGVGGECETAYVIQSEPYYETPYQNNVLNVTKTRNYHKCRKQPYHTYVGEYGDRCVECEEEPEHPIHVNSRYYYSIRGSRYHYVIERVVSEGELLYAPYTTRGQTAYVYLNRTLELREERDDDLESYTIRYTDVRRYTSLAYQFEGRREGELTDLKKAHYLYDVYGYQVPVNEIGRLLHQLAVYDSGDRESESYRSRHVPGKFVELIKQLSTLDYHGIEEVYRRYVDREDEWESKRQKREGAAIRSLFVSALAVTGTNPSFVFAKYLIEDHRIDEELIRYYLQVISFHLKEPTEALLDEFYRLCTNPSVQALYQVRSTCYLSFSTLVHETCVARHRNVHRERHCTSETARRYFNYLVPRHRYEEDLDQITYIKTAGNFGLRETIEYLKYYAQHKHEPLYFRVSALWALSRVVTIYPEEVLDHVLPLYFDTSEDYEVRIVAFSLIVKSEASYHYLETIANSLYHEPSDQVKSYVYSTFYYLANSTHPCHRKISHEAKQFLVQLESLDYDFQLSLDHSFNFFTAGYEEEYDYGGYTQLSIITSNSSYVPRNAYLRINDYFGGESHSSVSFGYQAYGVDKYLDRLFGPEGPYKDSSLFENLGRRSPRDVNTVEKELKEFHDKIHIKTREYEPLYGEFFINHQGAEISFFHFNESYLEQLLGKDRQRKRATPFSPKFRFDRHLLGTDRLYVFPTDFGLPLIYDAKQPLYLHYESRNAKLTVEAEKNSLVPKEVKAEIDGHLLFDHELLVTLAVVIPYERVTHGSGIYRRSVVSLPIKADLSLDIKDSKFSFKYTPVTPHNVFHLQYEPFTFVDSYADHLPIVSEDNYVPLYEREYMQRSEHDYFQDYLGIGLRLRAEYHDTWNDYGSWFDYLSSSDFRQQFYRYFANPYCHPYYLIVYAIPAERDRTEQIEGVISYDYYGAGDEKGRVYKSEHVADGIEDYGQVGGDRRWYSHVLTGDLYARGQRDRQVKTELVYSYSYDYLHHKYHFFYDRTPFHHSEKSHFKICLSGIWNYPHHDYKKFVALKSEKLDNSVNTTHSLYFGADCKSDKKITLQGHLRRTEEEDRHIARREEPVTYERFNEYAYYYQKCLQGRQHGYQYNSYCHYYVQLTSQLRDYHFHITYEKLPEYFRNQTYRLASYIRHQYYTHVEYDPYAPNPEGQVRIEANLSLHDPVVDLRVYKPHETTYYNRLYVPHLHPVSTYPSIYYSYLGEYLGLYDYPYCRFEKDEVRTYDNVTYTFPITDCYQVVAKDCSPKEEFVVLSRKVTHQRYEKTVKIFFGQYKVEALPVSEQSELIVRVNGKHVAVTENEPYYQYITEHEHQHTLFFVSYNGVFYTFHSHRYGLTVRYDGRAIMVQLSPYHRGKQCGLCGDYNGDQQHEFLGPDGCQYYDIPAYSYSYSIPEDGCTVPSFESPCKIRQEQDCVEQRNRYVVRESGRERKLCFSTTPVPRCAEGCVERGRARRNLAFHCLPAEESFTQYLRQEADYRVLEEVRKKSEDYHTEVEHPEGCTLPQH